MFRWRREKGREERWAASLQSTWTQELKNLVRVICELILMMKDYTTILIG